MAQDTLVQNKERVAAGIRNAAVAVQGYIWVDTVELGAGKAFPRF